MSLLTPRYAALADAIESRLGGSVRRLGSSVGELGYEVDSASLLEVCTTLRDTEGLQFDMLVDLCGVDYLTYGRGEWRTEEATDSGFSRGIFRGPGEPADADSVHVHFPPSTRFAVVYHLLSIALNQRLRLKVFVPEAERPIVDSVISVWRSADWFEREAFDLFGILFRGHPDLRRILTDYGFIGHPFRKDFPLVGNVEMRYDPEKGRVVYQPVSIEPRTLVPKVLREDHRYDPDLKDSGDA
jgi:NADH-quinone oxidoreductase subunit C